MKIFHAGEERMELSRIEVDVLTKIKHQRIVNMIEHGQGAQKDGNPFQYILLEMATNGSLFDYIAHSGRFNESSARYIFNQLLEGVGYLHSSGFAHRDLKPENLLFDSNFDLKISDFGFADAIDVPLREQLGTDGYMAPEIVLGQAYSGQSVDLFAAAIILFTMITGRRPFERAHPHDPNYYALVTDPRKFWRAHAREEEGRDIWSDEFKDLFVKMISFEPNLRPDFEDVRSHPWMMGDIPSRVNMQDELYHRKMIVKSSHNIMRLKRRLVQTQQEEEYFQ